MNGLRRPVRFTVPDNCEVDVWHNTGYNYKILADWGLTELTACEYNGIKGRKAYIGDTVLVLEGSSMTVWAFK